MRYLPFIILMLLASPLFAHPHCPENIVRVYVYQPGDDTIDIYGSGALISPTQVLTNHHVIKSQGRGKPILIRFHDGRRIEAKVLQTIERWDIALLSIPEVKEKPFKFGKRPRGGISASIHGFGYDYEYRTVTGTVDKRFLYPNPKRWKGSSHKEADFFEIDNVEARNGDSGGPVTDKNGLLIGILFGTGSQGGEHYVHGTTIDRIQKEFNIDSYEDSDYNLIGAD